MTGSDGQKLFSQGDLETELRQELSKVVEIVTGMAADDVLDRSDEEAVAFFMHARAFSPLELL